MDGSVHILNPEQTRQMAELAEQAQVELSRFAGEPVDYDATALQLLDEWVERQPSPPRALRILWTAFVGEIFRRRHGGRWALRQEDGQQLLILCPTEGGAFHAVAVTDQIDRRIANGMADSLALFYLHESILLRQPRDL